MSFPKRPLVPFALLLVSCAAREPEIRTTPPPIPAPRAGETPVWSDPSRQPSLAVRIPAGWSEAYSRERRGEIVLVDGTGTAMIVVALRLTDDRPLDFVAAGIVAELGPGADASPLETSASGDAAWFSWARHPTDQRGTGAHGRVRIVRFPTMPERMAVISGIWPYGRGGEHADAFDRVADGVQLR
jgi:hypothetical protein